MNSKNIHKEKKYINGKEVYIEVCEDGEFTTVNPKCYDNLFGVGEKHSIKELLLLLLGVDPEIPLKQTLLMKEAFLFEKELSFELNLIFEPLNYVPYKFGPYSKTLDDTIDSMHDLLDISVSSNKKEIKLNEKGKREALKFINSLPKDKVKKLKMKRIGWDQWGNKGILKRVYTDYPVYTARSEIKDEVLGK